MVFSSHLFIYYFLPLVLAVYYLLPRWGRHLGLTVSSYLFYGWANPAFLVLMLLSTTVDYVCGLWMSGGLKGSWKEPIRRLPNDTARTRSQRAALTLSIVTNLALLGF